MEKINVSQQAENSVKTNTSDKLSFSEPTENFRKTTIDNIWTQIWIEERGYCGTIGNRQCTEWYKTEKELSTKLKGVKNGKIDWDLIALVSITLADIERERIELNNKINKKNNG